MDSKGGGPTLERGLGEGSIRQWLHPCRLVCQRPPCAGPTPIEVHRGGGTSAGPQRSTKSLVRNTLFVFELFWALAVKLQQEGRFKHLSCNNQVKVYVV